MKQKLGLLIIAGMMAILISSCARNARSDTAQADIRSNGDVVLTFLMWGGPEETQATYAVLKSFQEKYTNIGIKVIRVDSLSYPDKLQAMFAMGEAPDVFYLHCENFFNYASRGLLYPLDEFTGDPSFDLEDFYPEIVNEFKFGGNLYGIPKDWTSFVIYYNKNLFDEAGIGYPAPEWTWEDFLNAAKALTKDNNGDGIIDRFGFWVETWATWHYSWIRQAGGEIFDQRGNWVFAKDRYLDKNAQALQFVADLINVHRVAPDLGMRRQTGGYEVFRSGRVAMCMYGRWAMMQFKNIGDFQWDYQVLPQHTAKASTAVAVACVMHMGTEHPAEAWKLIEYLTSDEGQIYDAESGYAIPSRRSVVESDHYLKAPEVIRLQPHLALESATNDPFIRQLPYACFPPSNPHWIEVRQKLDEQLDDVFLGNIDAKSVILRIDRIVSSILSESGEMEIIEGSGE